MEHMVTCPLFEPPLTQAEIRQIRHTMLYPMRIIMGHDVAPDGSDIYPHVIVGPSTFAEAFPNAQVDSAVSGVQTGEEG